MSRFSKYVIAWILVLIMYSSGNAFTVNEQAVRSDSIKGTTQTQQSIHKRYINTSMSVINIFIDKIEKTMIYAKDGRSFPIADSTNIINNHNPNVRVQTGELIFQNGNLVTIIIK